MISTEGVKTISESVLNKKKVDLFLSLFWYCEMVNNHWLPLSTYCSNRESFYQVELLINLLYTCKCHKKTCKCIDETHNNLHKMFFSPNQQLRSNLVDRHRRHMAAAGSNRESLYQLHLSDLRGKVMGYTIQYQVLQLRT